MGDIRRNGFYRATLRTNQVRDKVSDSYGLADFDLLQH